MAYTPKSPLIASPPAWRKRLPGAGDLQLERLESGRCYLRSGTIRVARAILLDMDKPGAYISHLHVKKKHRRRGYGRRLVQAMLHMAQQMDCEGISLLVQTNNTPAIALYKRVGFFICNTTLVDNEPHHTMAQRLNKQA